MKQTDYVIYSMEKATQLIGKGFHLKSTAPNKKKPSHLVFYFENTPELQKALGENGEG